MPVLQPIAKPNLAAARVLCEVLRNLRTIDIVFTVNAGWTVLELILGLNRELLATGLSHGTDRLTGEKWEMPVARVARTYIKRVKLGSWSTKMLLISCTFTVHRRI